MFSRVQNRKFIAACAAVVITKAIKDVVKTPDMMSPQDQKVQKSFLERLEQTLKNLSDNEKFALIVD